MNGDFYPSLQALKACLRENLDYRTRILNRNSKVTILAPHGGLIEPGTSALARAIAGRQYNLYDFQGLRLENPSQLHVTSTKFRELDLSVMLHDSAIAVSVHSMGSRQESVIWLGGRNTLLKDLVLANLRLRGFLVNPDSPFYRGESKKNIVNFACHEGVQLELSTELLNMLFERDKFLLNGHAPRATRSFVDLTLAVRKAIQTHQKLYSCRLGCIRCPYF